MEKKKLYRSTSDKIIGGVCGGFAEYFNIDPTIMRIIWVVFACFKGIGVLAYLVALVLIPVDSKIKTDAHVQQRISKNSRNFAFFIGIGLITIGLLILLYNTGLLPYRFWHLHWDMIFAFLLIASGIYLFIHEPSRVNSSDVKKENLEEEVGNSPSPSSGFNTNLHKSLTDKKLFGVCGGIAEHFNIDSSIVRILWVVFGFTTAGIALLLYLLLALILPEEKLANS